MSLKILLMFLILWVLLDFILAGGFKNLALSFCNF